MAQARFAEIISRRRKELRLSISQAAKVLRMRESVLEAFEEGDFDRLPPLGYAQAMIASYARYLGLDSRQLTELYEDEHEQYVRARTGRPTSALARLADEPGDRNNSTSVLPTRSSGSRPTPLLQGSEGAAGYGTGYGAGSYGQGSYGSPAQGGYGYARSSREVRGGSQDSYGSGDSRDGMTERRYTARVPHEASERARRQQQARRARMGEGARGSEGGRYRTRDDEITTRRVSSGQYRDDMRFDSEARPYRPSSTRAGREATRSIGTPERPNVRRRQAPPRERDPRMRSRRGEPQPQGFAGVVQQLMADPRRFIPIAALALALVLALILVFSIRSCAAGSSEPKSVQVITASTTAAATTATTASAEEQKALSDAAAKQAALSAAAASQETIVKVSVAEGASSWVEITCDGTQEVAETITGAWSEEYTVTKSIEIQVVDPSAVTVEKNGERVQLSSKTAGLASITIQGTDPAAATTGAATTDAASDKESGSKSSGSGSSSR